MSLPVQEGGTGELTPLNRLISGRMYRDVVAPSKIFLYMNGTLPMSPRVCLCLASILGFFAVMLGAFGAHGLKDTGFLERKYAGTEPKNIAGLSVPASYKYLKDFETGVEYHMTHTLAMALTGLLMLRRPSGFLSVAASCFLAGILLFSGTLYVLVIGGPRWLGVPWGMIAPIGGTLQLIGWLALAAGAWTAASCPLSKP